MWTSNPLLSLPLSAYHCTQCDGMGRRDQKSETSSESLNTVSYVFVYLCYIGAVLKIQSHFTVISQIEARCVAFKTPATAVLLLKSPEEDILIKACEAIYEFAEEGDMNKVYLTEHGALEPLSQLITHNNCKIRRNAIIGLGVMATNSTARSALQNMDIIPTIIDKLSINDAAVQEFGTLCLSCLSADSCCQAQIIENKGLPLLVNLLSNADPDVQKNSLDIIYNLIQDTQLCRAVIELQGLRQLLALLKSTFSALQQLALKTLQVISTCEESQSAFRDERLFDDLIEILNDQDLVDLHGESLLVLSNCMSDFESFRVIQKGGGLSLLMELLINPKLPESPAVLPKNGSPEIQAIAVKCIAGAAQNPGLQPFLNEQRIEKVLVDFLTSGSDGVKMYACQAFALLTSFPPSKDLFRDLGAIPVVVRLLKSKCPEILEHAIQGLTNITSGDQHNTIALEILQEITQSITRRSKFTEFALISLLKYNVSVKYGLLGYLAATDVITFGFYDAGKVSFCQKVLTLEELCMEPVNQLRPVILVNAIEMSDEVQQKDEAQSESSQERNRKVMDDIALPLLVKEVKESIEPLNEEQEQYVALARFVSEIMGGAIEKEDLDAFPWLQHLDELRCKLQCNVIPIGMITKGFYCHRALLFKYLADAVGLRCTLVRGDYNRAWNEVLLYKGDSCSNENFSQPCCYIVDLMHEPGTFLEVDSIAASQYESL
ncbi:armadillo repeat-containing protein 3-like isoform X7 [Hippocampus zosterae]|uniref:armadillo repeat-containing protein 3-like isoform X7 n=1 Tax=Hippocampus zosterae TaxID=109293 RepID=UPI00223E2177|nr:armadillo repeat-containing protein 3-like isoform X7 [Hippocampus zosterae]